MAHKEKRKGLKAKEAKGESGCACEKTKAEELKSLKAKEAEGESGCGKTKDEIFTPFKGPGGIVKSEEAKSERVNEKTKAEELKSLKA